MVATVSDQLETSQRPTASTTHARTDIVPGVAGSDVVRSVLCFGDSNTYGYLASTDGRLGRWERWTGVAQRALGVDDWYLIEDGLGGRTTSFEFPGTIGRNGRMSLLASLELHEPLDALVIFLGTNDICLPGVTAAWAAAGVESLIEAVRTRPGPDPRPNIPILVVAPPPFLPLDATSEELSPWALAESERFSEAYGAMSHRVGVELLDLRGVAAPTELDGIHFEQDAHRAIGMAVAEALRSLLQ
jgi:lysophospholipase L1-like esterase